MPWDRSRPGGNTTRAKYRSKEHRDTRATYAKQMQRDGYLLCAQPVCVMPDRVIPLGARWHLGHDDTGTRYIGPVHGTCNVRDGARRGRERQQATRLVW